MESEYRKGYVYIQHHFAGIIAETEEGYAFSYSEPCVLQKKWVFRPYRML